MNNRASFIEIVTATFAAGESRLFALTGQYFELIDATFPVDVTLSDFYGAQRGLMKSAEASFNLKNTEFGVIQITSASAQTIRFAYGTGEAGTRRAAGAVSIVGTVPVNLDAAQLAQLLLLNRPLSYGASFDSVTALAATTAEQVFAAAANVNGCIVHAASWAGSNAGAVVSSSGLVAAAVDPVAFTSGDVLMQVQSHYNASGVVYGAELQSPVLVPAGKGLWFWNQSLEAGGGRRVLYTLL